MKEDEQSFESLRRLLTLKQYEVPPPGYFNNFSRQLMARIRAGEAEEAASVWERLAGTPWFYKWLSSLETKPVFAGGFAMALCLVLLFGALMAQRPESASQTLLQPTRETTPFATIATGTPVAPPALVQPVNLMQPVNQIMIADNSTNPVINFGSPAVEQGPHIQMLPFQISGGN